MGRYILENTPANAKSLVYKNSKEIRIHSAYDPEKEAQRAVSGFTLGRATCILVSGIGLGYHLKHLKIKFPGTRIIAMEHDSEVIDIAVKTYPRHLEGTSVVTEIHKLSVVFEDVDISGFRGIAHFIHRPSYSLYPDFYDGALKEVNQCISSKVSDLLTRFEFEEKWVENIFSNLHHLYSSGRVTDLFGKFRGYPGIIVSAGPSLRKNAGMLRKMRDRALIVSVDTAVKVLQKLGIAPHIAMTLDAQKHSIRHFQGLTDYSPVLLADLVSYPPVMRAYTGRKVISTTSKYYTDSSGRQQRETTPAIDWIERHIRPVGDIQSGGSVSTSAFDLLLNLGCDPIILVGQDLAYTGREIHCSGTHHNDDWLPRTSRFSNLDTINQAVIRKRKIKYVPAFGGRGEVISDFVFDLYRGWFEDSARKVSVAVINATEGGAQIQNTREASLESLAKGSASPGPSPDEILSRSISGNQGDSPAGLTEALSSALKEIQAIGYRAREALSRGGPVQDLEDLINREEIKAIFNPFLRKAKTFLSRYQTDREKSGEIILKDIISAVSKLEPAIVGCLENLKNLEREG